MAKYNREFLVPYLHNVCALELLREKLNDLRWHYDLKVSRVYNIPRPTKPQPPELRSQPIGAYFSLLLLGIGMLACLLLLLMLIFMVPNKGFFTWVIIAVVAFILLMLFAGAEDPYNDVEFVWKHNKSAKESYEYNCRTLKERQHEWEHRMDNMTDIEKMSDFFDDEYRKVDHLLDDIYDVNVIPGQYRTKYAAIYLYEYFSKSHEDDLALALNTFVLEEIKEKLDVIIEQQSEILINQRMQIALQQKSIAAQERHTQMMKNKLNKMQASLDEQKCYLKMIESDASATAYFAAARYISSI